MSKSTSFSPAQSPNLKRSGSQGTPDKGSNTSSRVVRTPVASGVAPVGQNVISEAIYSALPSHGLQEPNNSNAPAVPRGPVAQGPVTPGPFTQGTIIQAPVAPLAMPPPPPPAQTAYNIQPSADYLVATYRQLVPGGPTAYTVPRQQGTNANDVTSFHSGQAYWNLENLPDIMYRWKPTDQDKVPWKYPRPAQKRDANGNLMWDPKYPQDDKTGRRICDFDILPERIGTAEQEWYFEAIRRLDQRIEWRDILARMQPDNRPAANTLNMRGLRFRQKYDMSCWDPRGRFSASKEGEDIIHRLNRQQIDNNTTRGTTPGLIDPALGEAPGNRVATPQQRNTSLSKPHRRKNQTKRKAAESGEREGEAANEATPVKRKRLDRAEHKRLREPKKMKASGQPEAGEGAKGGEKQIGTGRQDQEEEKEEKEEDDDDATPTPMPRNMGSTSRHLEDDFVEGTSPLAVGPPLRRRYRQQVEDQPIQDSDLLATLMPQSPPPAVRQRAPHEYFQLARAERINDPEFQQWLRTRGMTIYNDTFVTNIRHGSQRWMSLADYRLSDLAWNDFFGIPR
ncbi:MAG: hypothetical protein M1835_003864 [Candelina submexicana]|nr:MAG: hypothetical protein M1835_003864 [Candelina submexicana]